MTAGGEFRQIAYGEGAELIRELLHSSPTAMAIFQADQRIKYVNPKLEQVTGWTRAELFDQPYTTLIPERLREDVRRRLEGYLAQPAPQPLLEHRPDFPCRRKDGTEFPLRYSIVPIHAPEGLWVVVSLEDVTEVRRTMAVNENLTQAYRMLARMSEVVTNAATPAELFEETCRTAFEEGGFAGAWVGLIEGGVLRPVARAGHLEHIAGTLTVVLDPARVSGRGPSSVAIRENRAVYLRDFSSPEATEPWHRVCAEMGIEAMVSLPLRAADRVVATLNLYAYRSSLLDEVDSGLFDRLGANVSLALDRFEAERRLKEVAAQRRHLLGRLVAAEERERRRIAGEVHDESVQSLAAVDLRLGLLQRRAREVAPDLVADIDQLSDLLRGATTSLRDLMFNLDNPSPDLGLVHNLESAVEHVFVDGGLTWSVDAEEVDLGELLLGQALRVVKEALINVRKHARAEHVWITARTEGDGVLFEVADDGVGLPAGPPPPGHRGLVTMRERVEVSGGWLRAERRPEGGSQVVFWLPLESELG